MAKTQPMHPDTRFQGSSKAVPRQFQGSSKAVHLEILEANTVQETDRKVMSLFTAIGLAVSPVGYGSDLPTAGSLSKKRNWSARSL